MITSLKTSSFRTRPSLMIFGAALLCQGVLFACGEEAPTPVGSNNDTANSAPSTNPTGPNIVPGNLDPGPMPVSPTPATMTPTPSPTPVDTNTPAPVNTPGPAGTLGEPITPPVPNPAATPPPTPVTPTPTTPTPTPTPTTPAEPEPVIPMGGTGNALTPDSAGWIALSTNGVGVEGGWYAYDDGFTTDSAQTFADGTVCMTGTVAQQEDPAMQWGAGMGLVLSDGGANVQNPWDGTMYSGFSFTAEISAGSNPVTIELVMDGVDPPHEATLTNGANSITWASVAQPSWAPTPTTFSAATLTKIQFKVATVMTAATPFSVCISNLTVTE